MRKRILWRITIQDIDSSPQPSFDEMRLLCATRVGKVFEPEKVKLPTDQQILQNCGALIESKMYDPNPYGGEGFRRSNSQVLAFSHRSVKEFLFQHLELAIKASSLPAEDHIIEFAAKKRVSGGNEFPTAEEYFISEDILAYIGTILCELTSIPYILLLLPFSHLRY